MTATEWLFKELWECDKDKFTWHNIFEQAKEMEKQQIIDAVYEFACRESGNEYYNKKYNQCNED